MDKVNERLAQMAREAESVEELKLQKLNDTYGAQSKGAVDHPAHYQGVKYECIDVMVDVFGREKTEAFCELNAFKYLWRSNAKGANVQDKEKAIWYLTKYNELKKEQ